MLLKRRKLRLCCFTLLELLVSMGVFAILMFALMQFFTSAQSIWTRSNTRYDMYDNARLALNLMATDLQCLYYDDYKTNAKYFDVSGSDDKWTLSLATQRSDSSSACTSLVLVYYQYDKEKGTLSFKQVTDYDADNKSQDWITKGESGIDVLSGLMSLGSWTVLAENIVDFPVPTCQYLPQAGTGNYVIGAPDSPPNKIPIPQRVILSMTLIDSDTRKKLTPILASHKKDFKDVYDIAIKKEEDLEDGEDGEKPIADLAKQSIQTFVQAVSIDR